MAKKFREDIEIKSSLANHSWLVTKNMTSSTPDKIAGTSWKNVIVDENWEIMVWDVQRMTTRQTLTPIAIVTANPLVPTPAWSKDSYTSTVQYWFTVPTWWNFLYDISANLQTAINKPNHDWHIYNYITSSSILYFDENSDWYSREQERMVNINTNHAYSYAVPAWAIISATLISQTLVDIWIAPIATWWSFSINPSQAVVTFIPTY